jgi:hypothetical protein
VEDSFAGTNEARSSHEEVVSYRCRMSSDVNIPATLLGGLCFAFAGWYYFFQPHSFHRAMEETALHSPGFVAKIRFFAKPIGILSFVIATILFAVALKHLIT